MTAPLSAAPAARASSALCVAVHDVAPETWPRCESLIAAVAQVAPLPLTLLVVPNYHRQGEEVPVWYRDALLSRRACGDELALHGYVHCDEAAFPCSPRDWWQRRVMTAREGEFAALGPRAAEVRLRSGLDWFQRQGWRPRGFVPPAWLLSRGSWRALEASPLLYTTTADAFHLLRPRRKFRAPCLVYGSRSVGRRLLSLGWNAFRGATVHGVPVRMGLHPVDAGHRDVVLQFQRLLEKLLRDRTPMTKAALAALLQPADARAGGFHGLTTASESSATAAPSATPPSTSLG